MSKGRSRKVAKPEDPLIGCDKCGRWAYVSESDFKNTQEAENADFICRICKMIDEVDTTHRNKSEELETIMTDMIKRWEDTNEAGAVDQNDMIHALLDRVDKLEHCVEELVKRMSPSQTDKVTLDKTMEESPEYSARPEQEKENEKKPNQIDYQRHGPVMSQSGTLFPETYDSGVGPHLQHENGMMQVHTKQQVATTSVKDLPSQVGDDSNTTTMNGTRINQRHIDEHIRPPQGVTREVIVAGDNNVARFARTLVDRVGDHRRMEILYNRGGTIADVHHLIDEYEEKARKVPRMYILHVGVNDIVHGEQPAAIVEQLRLKWTDHKDALAICSIPEIEGRGKGIQAATMLLNAQLKKLCKNLKARFIDLSRDLKAEDAMERGRLHYKEDGVRNVVNRLGAVASLFLGIQWRRDSPTSKIGQQRSPLVEHRNEPVQGRNTTTMYGKPQAYRPAEEHRMMHQAMGCLHAQHTDDPVNRWHAGKTEALAGKPYDHYPVKEQRTDYQRSFPPLGPVRELERRTPRPQDIVHCLDSNMQLPPSQNSHVALGRAPAMDPLQPQRQTLSNGGLPGYSPQSWTPPTSTHLSQMYTPVLPQPQDLRAIVAEMVSQQLGYHYQRHRV
ncbi:hypothetical protein HPB47_006293 [Ixodes persulcatus]|uniref:Uncharacterized protein n=1 Tax=Ixodes persulcatus TaxID=34615 RepID=A0AC60PBK1_IXOPE|nr:hypothetical protein HPB47_006293 [Ixodes persulcatus]